MAIYGNSNDEEVYYSCQPTGTGKKIHGIWKDHYFGEQHSLLTDAFQKLNTFASEGPQTQSHSAVQKEWRTLLCLKVLCVLTAAGIIAPSRLSRNTQISVVTVTFFSSLKERSKSLPGHLIDVVLQAHPGTSRWSPAGEKCLEFL